ncbi:MAG: hypothetical protein LKI34_05665 [Bifidobacterium tibiigranuli]|jgi:hypothetical protein|uniref:hypothetical protein n=1 Tax=Bifidobacterium tibiigranuli TaxID=2172043 RepID=UPI0026EF84E9|nr:hypothetical protein [Bifidobacterium tibiigranuli]MCI1673682.1 hypothetical protein [Bifidobacterium tibiigranuli]MCI1712938.1 hypothetical protein [Bifidobacterium tibiigranuli]MCI1833555.1 hypothetical protein [Bifidobacterium tibiigranuli]
MVYFKVLDDGAIPVRLPSGRDVTIVVSPLFAEERVARVEIDSQDVSTADLIGLAARLCMLHLRSIVNVRGSVLPSRHVSKPIIADSPIVVIAAHWEFGAASQLEAAGILHAITGSDTSSLPVFALDDAKAADGAAAVLLSYLPSDCHVPVLRTASREPAYEVDEEVTAQEWNARRVVYSIWDDAMTLFSAEQESMLCGLGRICGRAAGFAIAQPLAGAGLVHEHVKRMTLMANLCGKYALPLVLVGPLEIQADEYDSLMLQRSFNTLQRCVVAPLGNEGPSGAILEAALGWPDQVVEESCSAVTLRQHIAQLLKF